MELVFNEYRVSVKKDQKILEINGGKFVHNNVDVVNVRTGY